MGDVSHSGMSIENSMEGLIFEKADLITLVILACYRECIRLPIVAVPALLIQLSY